MPAKTLYISKDLNAKLETRKEARDNSKDVTIQG